MIVADLSAPVTLPSPDCGHSWITTFMIAFEEECDLAVLTCGENRSRSQPLLRTDGSRQGRTAQLSSQLVGDLRRLRRRTAPSGRLRWRELGFKYSQLPYCLCLRRNCRVEVWRGVCRSAISVCRPFRLAVPHWVAHSAISTPRSSNRTCRATASGSRTRRHAFTHDASCPSRVRRMSPKCP
jgi:hypothetical protein